MKKNEFDEWLDKYIEEKGINLEETFSLEIDGVGHLFDYASIIEQMKCTSKGEQEKIRNKIAEIEFYNADVKDFFRHLAIPIAKIENMNVFGIGDYSLKQKVNRINAKNDIKKLDLLYRRILDTDLSISSAITGKDIVISQINSLINNLLVEYKIDNKEYLELVLENKNYKKLEDRTQKMADDRYNMIWDSCSPNEIAEILRNHYEYSDQEIIDEFDDEETKEDIKNFLAELKEIEEASKNVVLDNGFTFVFENEYCFSKLKAIFEDKQRISRIPDGMEFATITNLDVTKEAFLVKYGEDLEIVYNFYNNASKEMESYETELLDLSEIKTKEELIEVMKDKLEHFEEKYNKLEQDEENMEV